MYAYTVRGSEDGIIGVYGKLSRAVDAAFRYLANTDIDGRFVFHVVREHEHPDGGHYTYSIEYIDATVANIRDYFKEKGIGIVTLTLIHPTKDEQIGDTEVDLTRWEIE